MLSEGYLYQQEVFSHLWSCSPQQDNLVLAAGIASVG